MSESRPTRHPPAQRRRPGRHRPGPRPHGGFCGDVGHAALSDSSTTVVNYWATLVQGNHATEIKGFLNQNPELTQALNSTDPDERYAAHQALMHQVQMQLGLSEEQLTALYLFDAEQVEDGPLAAEGQPLHQIGGAVPQEGDSAGQVFLNVQEGTTDQAYYTAMGHEAAEAVTHAQGEANDARQEGLANYFGERFEYRLEEANIEQGYGELGENTGNADTYANSSVVTQGTQQAQQLGGVEVDYYLNPSDINEALTSLAENDSEQNRQVTALILEGTQKSAPVDQCRAVYSDCGPAMDQITAGLALLQDPETRATLGDELTDDLIGRQMADLYVAAQALEWSEDPEHIARAEAFANTIVGLVPVLGTANDYYLAESTLDYVLASLGPAGDAAAPLIKGVKNTIAAQRVDVGGGATNNTGGQSPSGATATPDGTLTHIDHPVDLTDGRSGHILANHKSGTGKPGKTEFPSNWSDDRIIHQVSDIASDPSLIRQIDPRGTPYVSGTRDGIEIRVTFFPDNHARAGQISSAYPINVPANPRP